ncbi:AraC family transcriptional regulator [Mucilaginibacter sp.]|uniref:helix-turn-helix domain-containing protein n=1 Tax=Mucilaginibacter sp. TaxID=1882438 RepID=UPI002848F0CD|nr:AraC family transcriptional regulator [Mucilaginibacter sp.]MDR3697736.1 AraC family transcriptional regulator [Mucilaginibacter sp.]
MKHFKSLAELHRANGFPPPENPLLSLFRCKNVCSLGVTEFTGDFYMIGFKKLISGLFLYGRTKYDHENGSMSFVKPRQVVKLENLEFEEDGFLIYFHEDFLNGHPLHSEIKKYNFFEYEANEALHLSPNEEKIIWELYSKIETEYYNNQDEYSRDIILAHIDSILKYSQRFYKRQFINRSDLSGKVVSKFNKSLAAYFDSGSLQQKGLPSVTMMASQLNLSSRYLSDILKQETGKTAIELIHIFLIAEAKNLLTGSDNNIAETAYTLGFDNLPYFSRLFKKEVGISPNQYKKMILN